jgi:small subunit ribosomal protein S19e
MAILDVPATELIEAVAADLKKQVKQPEWTGFVKSGRHRERAPHRHDWFYVRMASVLYRVYREGRVGTNRLRTYYGGRRNRGVKPHHFSRASGKVIRLCLQELEKAGLLKKEKSGRVISGKGESYLNAKAKELKRSLEEKALREKEAEPKPVKEKNLEEPKHTKEKRGEERPVKERPLEEPVKERAMEGKPLEKQKGRGEKQ